MLSRRKFLVTAALSAVSAPRLFADAGARRTTATACAWADGIEPKTIAIVGDLQRTSVAEAVLMSRSQNDAEREAILNKIADDRPDMLMLLGDQVSTGEDPDDWRYFDKVMGRVNKAGIPVRAIYGNHDYGRDKGACTRNFSERFPHQQDSSSSLVRLGPLAMITVDTNFDMLSSGEIDRQAQNYKKWLRELEDDPTVKGILVSAHHPPYTNSDLGSNPAMIPMFAEPFLQATKTRLFLSGHVHSYERFVTGDKMFVVTGGGGGPRRLVNNSGARPYHNDAYRAGTLRPFHYLNVTISEDRLSADVMMLRGNQFKVGDRFELGLYGSQIAAQR